MANRSFTRPFYTLHGFPVLLDCQFTVAAADTGGLGITGLKGPGVQAVYMHTSQTPAVGNPNPANGICLVQLQDSYYKDYLGFMGQVTALSGSSILVASAGTVANTTYVITILGTTTTAGWQSLGLPVGITPAVGVSFVATATATATGTGAVQVPHANGTGIQSIEQVGTPGLTLSTTGIGASYPYMIFRFMGPTNSSTTTPIAVAPRDGSIISLKMYMSNSSVVVAGE
jgi:hypothetical protein